ncbi:MAG: DUF6443 domain-containing protein, partial [Tannerella sp.]|nr:DUF6443 domain-containing protein [Tannerella sp.]
MKRYIIILLVLLSSLFGIYAQTVPETTIDIGVKNRPFTYIHTQNTTRSAHYFGTNAYDVWYKFTLERPMEVILSHCGSELSVTYLHLLNASKNLMTSLTNGNQRGGRCPDTDHPYFKKTLSAGTYYVVSEGYRENGNITTNIIVNSIENNIPVMDLGSKNGAFVFENTQNTAWSENYYPGKSAKDVWYKFTLEKPMEVILSHCGSELPNTYLHLLNVSKGTIISLSNTGSRGGRCVNSSHPYFREKLVAGTYYVVSEGAGSDGIITTRISGSEDGIPVMDLGVTNVPSAYTFTQNTTNLLNHFGLGTNDAWYKFTLEKYSEVTLSHCGSQLQRTYFHLLDASKNRMASILCNNTTNDEKCTDASCKKILPQGTYYVVSEGYDANGMITTNITINIPVTDLGTKSAPFNYTHTWNTIDLTNSYGQPANDAWYKFTLTKPMEVVISHCGSGLSDTYLYLLDNSRTLVASNDDYTGAGQCTSTRQAYLKKVLPAGTYYAVSEGKTGNGNITTAITVDIPVVADWFFLNPGSSYKNTQNTANSVNYYTGQTTSDVWYKFTLTKMLEVAISHCDSELSDTYLHLLDASKTLIASSDDYTGAGQCTNTRQAYLKKILPAGTYYAVSEGKTENGSITTTVSTHIPMTDLALLDSNFDYTDTQNTVNSSDYYTNNHTLVDVEAPPSPYAWNGQPTHDVWYRFAIPYLLEITVSNCGSELPDTYLYLLDDLQRRLDFNDDYNGEGHCSGAGHAYIKTKLDKGIYYIVTEGKTGNGNITTNITVNAPFSSASVIDLGSKSASFTYNNVQNTANSVNRYVGRTTKDVWYKFTLTKAMTVTISHRESPADGSRPDVLRDTYVSLLNSTRNLIVFNDDPEGNSSKEKCNYSCRAYLKEFLQAGTYYVVSEGYSENGYIVTNIEGNDVLPVTDLGSKSASFTYSDTLDTKNSANYYEGKPTNDVMYKFTLDKPMEITIDYQRSSLTSICLYLLDSSENLMASAILHGGWRPQDLLLRADLQSQFKKALLPGTYYIVAEGYSENGTLTTNIKGDTQPFISVGTKSESFTCTDTQDTRNSANFHTFRNPNDIRYRFTLTKGMEVTLSHCGSELSDTYIHLLDSTGTRIAYNDDYSGTGKCPKSTHSYLKKNLPVGTYDVISEGYSQNGIITTAITGNASMEVLPLTDIGRISEPFNYRHTQNTTNTANYYEGQNTNDVMYKFTLDKAMEIGINYKGSLLTKICMYLLDSSGALIASADLDNIWIALRSIDTGSTHLQQSFKTLLPAGVYYVVAEGKTANGSIITNISFDIPMTDLGSKNNPFDYSDTQNTENSANYYTGLKTNDVHYKFTLEIPLEVVVSHCESKLSDTFLSLLDESRNVIASNDDYDGDGHCFNTRQAYLRKFLPAGVYYVVAEGKTENGYITTRITASIPIIDWGTKSLSFTETHTGNTDTLANYYSGLSTKDVWFRFKLNTKMNVTVSNCGSGLPDTYLYLLDASKNRIVSNDDYTGIGQCADTRQACLQRQLDPGVYYIVSEGKNQNGEITTTITGTVSQAGSTASEPSTNQNYIRTRTYLSEDGSSFLDAVQYYDGLGRPSQLVQAGIAPGQKDLVARQEYDAFGRESKAWLPVPVAGNRGAYYTGTFSSEIYGYDTYAYSEQVYEPSPLNRIIKQYGPGQEWRIDRQIDNWHFVKTDYLANNTSYPCAFYSVSGDNLVKNGNYANNSLYVTETTDEDGNKSYEFKDKLDRIVLQRQMNETAKHDTYYVYDDFGNLRFVLPPLAADSATADKSYSVSDSYIGNYAYIYKYDHRNRCTEKKLPGCEPVNYIYDNADRLIFSQDGELRAQSQWRFSIPDVFGRIVLEGICTDPSYDDVVKAEYVNNASGRFQGYGYTASDIGLALVQLLQVNYYDNYKFRSLGDFSYMEYDYTVPCGFEDKRYGTDSDNVKSKGLLTGTVTAMLDSEMLPSVFYYDSRGRMIQSIVTNHLGGYERECVNYSFTGQPTQKQTAHFMMGNAEEVDSITETYTYHYDHAGRPTVTEYQIDGGDRIILSELTYDDLGRVKTKGLHGSKEKIAYDYNIRSWMRKIGSDHFEENLFYTDSNAPLFNGNISQVEWSSALNPNKQGYSFVYDELNRLTNAGYYASGILDRYNDYKEEAVYNKMGNITRLKRSQHIAFGLFDNLDLVYAGNQLHSVTEYGDASSGFVKPQGNPAREYAYNKNGAMTQDFNGGISLIQYNSLNLPKRVQFTYGHNTQYSYDASGMKRQVRHTSVKSALNVPMGQTANPLSASIMTTDYVSNLVYEGGNLKYILNPEGYAVRT